MIASPHGILTPVVLRDNWRPNRRHGRYWSACVRRVRDHRLHCSVCENVIGFYDPIVVLGPAGPRDTSLHDEPMLVTAPAVMHDRCVNSTDSGSPEH